MNCTSRESCLPSPNGIQIPTHDSLNTYLTEWKWKNDIFDIRIWYQWQDYKSFWSLKSSTSWNLQGSLGAGVVVFRATADRATGTMIPGQGIRHIPKEALDRSPVILHKERRKWELHPGKLTWNPNMEVWKMTFLFNWGIFGYYANLRGCIGIWRCLFL